MPNQKFVLMICVDQWAGNCLGVSGHPVVMTPTIDLLSKGGVHFNNTYSECPICIPARRSLMTGTSPRTHGDRVYNETLEMPRNADTLATAFSNAGYQCYAVGKMHVYPQRDRIGFHDVVLMEEGRNEFGVIDDYQLWMGEQGYVCDEWLHGMGNNTYYTRPWHLPESTHPTAWATKQMMRMIQRRDPKKPGFFYMSYQFPHPPLVPPQAYLDMYSLDEIDDPITVDNWSSVDNYAMRRRTAMSGEYSAKQKKLARQAYYATCTHIDHQIRLLLGTLREANILNDTIIVFVSDHGDMLFDHNMTGKTVFYENSARVPLIFSGVPIEERKDCDRTKLASLADVMPTLLDLCGIPVPESVEGIPLFSNRRHEVVYAEIGEREKASRMIVDGRYKLIYYPAGNHVQLFDLEADPLELDNLAEKTSYDQIRDRLTACLIEHLYSGDEAWAVNGELVGFEAPAFQKVTDFALYNQRGMHWPPPSNYHNVGNMSEKSVK